MIPHTPGAIGQSVIRPILLAWLMLARLLEFLFAYGADLVRVGIGQDIPIWRAIFEKL